MKKRLILGLTFLLFPLLIYAKDIDIGVSIGDGKLQHFYFSLSDYYRLPEERIIIIKKRYPIIVEEELPVLLLIVREAGVSPDVVIELRKRGYSWYDILVRFRLYPEVVFKRYIIYGPPYGKAWGYHKHKKKKYIWLDDDIIVLSNVKFLSEYYQEPPEVIFKYKEKYPKFIDVHYEIYEKKKTKKEKFEKPYYDVPKNWEKQGEDEVKKEKHIKKEKEKKLHGKKHYIEEEN